MEIQLEKWAPINGIDNVVFRLKSVIDDFNGLTINLEGYENFKSCDVKTTFSIMWEGKIESYRCSSEETYFKFIASKLWQNIRKDFKDWSFFKVINSPYVKWVKDESGGFMDEFKLIHFMIIAGDYILDIVSVHEPCKLYKN